MKLFNELSMLSEKTVSGDELIDLVGETFGKMVYDNEMSGANDSRLTAGQYEEALLQVLVKVSGKNKNTISKYLDKKMDEVQKETWAKNKAKWDKKNK